MSRKRKIWIAVSVVVALVLLIPLGQRWQAQWHLSAYRKKLIVSGEKLTVEELAPKRNPQATNTELFLKLTSKLSSFGDLSPSAMRSVKPGVARVVWRQTRCMQKIDDSKPAVESSAGLTGAVATNQATISQLQALLNAGGIEFIEDYSQPSALGNSHLAAAKELVTTFNANGLLALHKGQRQEAVDYLKSCGTVCQLTANDSAMIDQLVLYACMSITVPNFWEALQAGDWTDDQLAQLQRQWDRQTVLTAAEASLAMERAWGTTLFQQARSSRQGLEDILGIPDNAEIWNDFLLNARTGISELFTSYPRYWGWRWIWSYRDEERYLEIMQTRIEAMRAAQKGRSIFSFLKNPDTSDTIATSISTNFNVAGSLTAATIKFVALALRAQTMANMVTAAIALERFHLAHHAYPAALANLVPEFLPAVPVDCMAGHDLRYRLNLDGTYLLYSVGDDGVDNGGDPTPEKGKRMYFLNGRDWVWPRAATAEEVQAYEAEQNKPKAGSKGQH